MELGESLEDYLESILVLSEKIDHVRSVDVASYLGFSKPSVSHAVKLLEKDGYLQMPGIGSQQKRIADIAFFGKC